LRVPADKVGMARPQALHEVLTKHSIICPQCRCPEAVVLINAHFDVTWQCVDCEAQWPASDYEAVLLLGPCLKTVH
jgi:ribosomal protein L37AE/L43A